MKSKKEIARNNMFNPYNFDYKAYILETYEGYTYNLTEMPNKWGRNNFRNDDVILNSQEAVWVEKNAKQLDDYKLSSFTYRLFIKSDGDDTTYYLLDKDNPFITMEYSFTRLSNPIKGVENKYLWNFKWDKGLARIFFDDYILKQEPIIISDEVQTEKGFNFWKYLFREYVKDEKTHLMRVIDINHGVFISSIKNENQMDEFFTESKSGKFRFVLQKI